MPSKRSQSSKAKIGEAPPAATNFRQIKGITQLMEARLHRAGITTFDQLAELLPEAILGALGNLKGITLKQIVTQDWIGQAAKLAGKKPPANGSLGSEGFIIDLFLNKKKEVHSTQILHVSSDEGAKWDGWDSTQLLDFIVTRAGLVLPPVKTVPPEAARPTILSLPVTDAAPLPTEPSAPTPPAPTPAPPPPAPRVVVDEFEMIPAHSDAPSKLLQKGEPFDLRLSLATNSMLLPEATEVDYRAIVYAKDLEAAQQFRLGEVRGVFPLQEEALIVHIPRQDLGPGTYRLEASLALSKGAKDIGQPAQMRTIFQVY